MRSDAGTSTAPEGLWSGQLDDEICSEFRTLRANLRNEPNIDDLLTRPGDRVSSGTVWLNTSRECYHRGRL